VTVDTVGVNIHLIPTKHSVAQNAELKQEALRLACELLRATKYEVE
jgi:hypothetical protein